jgi:hypothetical protein
VPTQQQPSYAHTLLSALNPNYVCWVFLLLSSPTMGCKEAKHGDRGEPGFMVRNSLTHSYVQENQLATVEVTAPVSVANEIMKPESDEVSGLIRVL